MAELKDFQYQLIISTILAPFASAPYLAFFYLFLHHYPFLSFALS